MDSAQDSYKKWGIALIIFLLILIPAEIGLTRPNAIENLKLKFQTSFSEKPKVRVIPKEEVAASFEHLAQYYIQFKHDPRTKRIIKLGSGEFPGDQDLLQAGPSTDPGDFNYRLEVISAENELLVSGWKSLSKLVISDEENDYIFRVSAPYKSGEMFKVYSLEGDKLWEETIK